MKVEKILEIQQPDVHKKLNQNRKRKKKRKRGKKDHLSFSDFENMMKHDSYYRGKGEAIKQRK